MKRSGFSRKTYVAPAPPPARPLAFTANYGRQEYTDGGRPKEPRLENQHLLLMARRSGQSCLLQVEGVCWGAKDDTCACHGNSAIFGKGMGMKAHDFYTVRGCARCHTWLDTSYIATYEERMSAFMDGMSRQISEWRRAVLDPRTSDADRRAIQWALDNLKREGFI
jgi:hypothetical protein